MRALVTGGSGFIGSNLAHFLEGAGHDVVVIDNFHSADRGNLEGLKAKLVTADVSEPFAIDGPFDAVFHQAAITDPRYGNDEEVWQKNVRGFERLIEFAEIKGAKLVYASTAGLYGNGPLPMQEDQPKELLTVYGKSKWEMDKVAESLKGQFPMVGLRYFNVFGPREAHKGRPASMIYHLWKQMRAGNRPRLFKYGEQVRDFVYVKDVVRANLLALEGRPGVYNVGTGVGTTFNELVRVLNEVLETDLAPEYFDMPYDPKTYQHHTIANPLKAKEDLGFVAEWDFPKAVRDYVAWLEANAS